VSPAPVGTSPGARRPGVRALDGARWSASAVRPRLEKARGLLRVSSPEGAGTAVLGGRAALGQPRPGGRAVGDYSQPAPRPTCPRRKAVVPKDASQPARTGNRSARWCSRLHKSRVSDSRGLPKEAGAHPRSGQLPRRTGDLSCRALAGPRLCVERAGLLRLARRRQGPACRATPPFSSGLESPIGGSLQARACLAIAIPARGRRVSVETCCRSPVVVRPAHALAGRAGTVRRLPEEADGSGSCYRQGRTGKETQDESPARGIQFRQSAPLVPWPRGPGHRPRGSARGFRTNPEPDDRSAARHVAGGEPVSQVGSPKRTWFTEVNHDPPKRTVRARRSGTWWSAEADRLARRSGPVGHLPGDPSSAGLSAVQTDLNREVSRDGSRKRFRSQFPGGFDLALWSRLGEMPRIVP